MSLKVDKDNIFFILPESRYAVSNRIDGYMEKDFTLHIRAKVLTENLTEKEAFLIARNGMHSGISFFKDSFNNIGCIFTYWCEEQNGENVVKQVNYTLDNSEVNDFNDFTIIGDNNSKSIECYVNSKLIGSISYKNGKKVSYENSFYWFGCGNMICEEAHRSVGDFEYQLAFILNKKLSIEEINDLTLNYKTKYTIILFNNLRKFKNDFKYKDNFAFFCDFEEYNRYKVWDLSFNGNYPQFYIEKNIYF